MTKNDDATLPPEAAKALRELATARVKKKIDMLVEVALTAVGFPDHATLMPLPEDLTRRQRAVAVALAPREDIEIANWAIPRRSAERLQWLGLAPGGVLERLVPFRDGKRENVPLWRALAVAGRKSEKRSSEVFEALDLTLAERLEVLARLRLDAYPIEKFYWDPAAHITGEAGEWAAREADRLVALNQETKSKSVWLPLVLSNAVLLAIVRAKLPIAPRWDELVDGAQRPTPELRDIFLEILRALPEPRRTNAIVKWFARTYTADAVALSLSLLLPEFPSVALTKAILDGASRAKLPLGEVVSALEKIALKHEIVGGAIVRKKEAEKPLESIVLSLGRVAWPKKVTELTSSQRKQLVEMGHGYDGKRLPAASRFGDGEDAHASSLLIRELLDARGKVAYEAMTWLADDGCVFVAGTTKEVASLVQHGVECDDPSLEKALEKALSQRPKKSPGPVAIKAN